MNGQPTNDHGHNQWAFHVVATIVCVLATAAAGVAAVIVSFGTSVCNEADTSSELLQLRVGVAVIGLVLTLVPTAFALAGRKLRFVWQPWAAVAVVAALLTIGTAASAQVSTWCF